VFKASQHNPADRDHVHVADGLADHRKGIVSDLAVGTKVIRSDDVAGIDLLALHELVDIDGARGLQRHVFKLFLGHFDVAVGVDLEAPDDVLVRYFLTGLGVDARILDAMAGVLVDLIEADFSESAVARNKAIGQVTRERRKKPFQLTRGAIQNTPTQQNLDSRRSCRVGSDNQLAAFRQKNTRQSIRLLFASSWPVSGPQWPTLNLSVPQFGSGPVCCRVERLAPTSTGSLLAAVLTHAMSPARQRRAIEHHPVLEALLAAEVEFRGVLIR
jgi:hypothetical protein